MKAYNSIRDYVETSLFHFPSIFPTRFAVLEHMFAVNGNGIHIQDGVMFKGNDLQHPSTIYDIEEVARVLHSRKPLYDTNGLEQLRNDGFSELVEKLLAEDEKNTLGDVKTAIAWESNYSTYPNFDDLDVYEWSNNERYQPFRKFAECTYDDLIENLEYFRDCIVKSNVSTNDDTMARNSLADWKENINVLNDFIESLKK